MLKVRVSVRFNLPGGFVVLGWAGVRSGFS